MFNPYGRCSDVVTAKAVELDVKGWAIITSSRVVKAINEKWAEEYRMGICSSLYGVRPVEGKYHMYEAYKIA